MGTDRRSSTKVTAAPAPPRSSGKRKRRKRGERAPRSLVVLVILAAVFFLGSLARLSPHDRQLREAAAALEDKNFSRAARLAEAVLAEDPASARAHLLLGQIHAVRHDSRAALEHFQQVPDDGSALALQAQYGIAIRSLRLGDVAEAERALRHVLAADPSFLDAQLELAELLQLEGRSWESLPHLMTLLQHGQITGDRLVLMASTEFLTQLDEDFLAQCLRAAPRNPLPLLKRARLALQANDRQRAEQILREIVRVQPDQGEAQGRLGRLLLERPVEYRRWAESLSPAEDGHPEIWVTQGLWARQQNQPRAAVRCFWEALRLHPDHLTANHQLAACLLQLGRSEEAAVFAERAKTLDKVNYLLGDLGSGYEMARQMAELMQSLGRYWEAAAWCHVCYRARPDLDWPLPALRRLRPLLQVDSADGRRARNPALEVDFSQEPLPQLTELAADKSPPQVADLPPCRVNFEDQAAAAGLKFQYYNGADPQGPKVYMFEFSGGGVAAEDFDLDGWPDVYFTQGCPWPVAPQTQWIDRLFRNGGDGNFQEVTAPAGLGDPGLSQGAAVGDFDNDGFPDLYVANLHGNRLYHNQGDGTYRDVTLQAEVAGNDWSTSCLIADVNSDSLPDIYVVNYLQPNAYEHQCFDGNVPVQCGPTIFEAAHDRLYLNRGDGRFEDVSEEAGILVPEGKGLAIVAADLYGTRELELFVANDTTANFLFFNQSAQPGDRPRFRECALVSGVACDALGRAQSCMGVAVGDVNGDQRLDMFVTNFTREDNALYVQKEDGYFVDEVGSSGLRDPGFEMMGWGTQCLDGELDGWPDLVVANGHINDFRNRGIPYQMRPQYLRNLGQGQFVEVAGPGLGSYFEQASLGRALARLDWNRDGREDFITTHVDSPASLLTNRTPQTGHFLVCQLRGTTSARDAIGTRVELTAHGRTRVQQLTAGDGFYASNQRQLVFGLGLADRVERLVVRWPSGLDQEYRDLPVDQEILLVEGGEEVVPRR